MLQRVLLVCSKNRVTAATFFAAITFSGPVFALPSVVSPTTQPPCIVKYDSLSPLVCPVPSPTGTLLADIRGAAGQLNSAREDLKESSAEARLDSPIREINGIKKQYMYTGRVAKDTLGVYSRMRQKPDAASKRGEILRPGDKIRVIQTYPEHADGKNAGAKGADRPPATASAAFSASKNSTLAPASSPARGALPLQKVSQDDDAWYYAEIFKSHDPRLEGKRGWIEKWIVDDENVPVEPTPTPHPTRTTPSNSKSTQESSGAAGSNTPSESVSSTEGGGTTMSGEAETLFAMVNDFREAHGLPRFEKSERLCAIARERAPEIRAEAESGTIHAGFTARGYGYPHAVENAAAYGSIQANFDWWKNSSLHRRSILGAALNYSCVECSSGNCVQIFSPNR